MQTNNNIKKFCILQVSQILECNINETLTVTTREQILGHLQEPPTHGDPCHETPAAVSAMILITEQAPY